MVDAYFGWFEQAYKVAHADLLHLLKWAQERNISLWEILRNFHKLLKQGDLPELAEPAILGSTLPTFFMHYEKYKKMYGIPFHHLLNFALG